ncbi:MAG: hypothetical protein FWD28_09975 [Treponema sp.]|nr:hypothetical protein [Treponema sp.]
MEKMPLLLLMIYSGFTINLVLQCALGIRGVAESKKPVDLSMLIKLLITFLSIILIWFFFAKILYSLIPGIFIYILLFPVSAVVYSGIEFIVFNYLLKNKEQDDSKNDSISSFYAGIIAAAVFICVNIASSAAEIIIMSFGFTGGILLVNFIIIEIRRRAALEAVPLFLRGKPLILIAMGLLSLVFTTASILLFRMIGTG